MNNEEQNLNLEAPAALPDDSQKKDKDSLYNYYKKLINFRNSCPAFAKDSQLLPYDSGNSAIASWIVQNKEKTARALVVHNVSTSPAAFALPQPFTNETAFQTNPLKKNKDGTLTIPPQTSVVFTDGQLLY